LGIAGPVEWSPEQVASDSVVPVSADMRPVGHQLGLGDNDGETSRVIQGVSPENVYAEVDDADVFEEIELGTESDGSSDGSTRVLIDDPSSTDASSGSETDTAAVTGISSMRNTAHRPSREWFSFMPSFSSGRHRGGGFWV